MRSAMLFLIKGLLLATLLFLVIGCEDDNNVIESQTNHSNFKGTINPPDDFPISLENCIVRTGVTSSTLSANGEFQSTIEDTSNSQIIFVESPSGNIIFLAPYFSINDLNKSKVAISKITNESVSNLLKSSSEDFTMDATTSAMGLGLLIPQLMGATDSIKIEYMLIYVTDNRFSELVTLITNSLKISPETTFDYNQNAQIYKLAVEIGNSSIAQINILYRPADGNKNPIECLPCFSDCPTELIDVSGPNVIFRNPRFIYIGCGIYNYNDLSRLGSIALDPREFKWVIVPDDPTETPYYLGDGQFSIKFFRGYTDISFDDLKDSNHPGGEATIKNTILGAWHIIDLIINIPSYTSKIMIDFKNTEHFYKFIDCIKSGKEIDAVYELASFIIDNADDIMYYFFQELTNPEEFTKFTSQLSGLIKNLTLATKIINATTKIPFFCDIIGTESVSTFNVQQVQGVLLPIDNESPSTPSSLICNTISQTQINLSWNSSSDNVGVTGYKIYRDGSYIKTVSDNSAPDYNLSAGTEYCYRVSAIDAAGNESYKSNQSCCTTEDAVDNDPPTTPTNFSCGAVSKTQMNLSWNSSSDNVGVTGYKIYRDGSYIKTVSGNSTPDYNLSAGTEYCYRVSAIDAAGNESYKSSQSCCTTDEAVDGEPPSTPANLSCNAASETQINLSWGTSSDNIGVTGYKIYRDGSYIKTVSGNSTPDYNLSSGNEYCYRVSAVDAAGNESYKSSQSCCTTDEAVDGEPPSTPSNLSCNAASETQINLSWVASTDNIGVTGYKIYRDGSYIKTVSGNNTPDYNLSAGNEYCYRVSAIDAAGNESYKSSQSCCTTEEAVDNDPPTTPTNLTCNAASKTQINLSWNSSSDNVGVTGYRVYRDGSYLKTVTSTSTSDYNLDCDNGYCYEVRAIDAEDNKSGYSDQSCCTTDQCETSRLVYGGVSADDCSYKMYGNWSITNLAYAIDGPLTFESDAQDGSAPCHLRMGTNSSIQLDFNTAEVPFHDSLFLYFKALGSTIEGQSYAYIDVYVNGTKLVSCYNLKNEWQWYRLDWNDLRNYLVSGHNSFRITANSNCNSLLTCPWIKYIEVDAWEVSDQNNVSKQFLDDIKNSGIKIKIDENKR